VATGFRSHASSKILREQASYSFSQATRLPIQHALFPAARRWHDPVHPEIFDQLPVVIEAMSGGKRGQEEARRRPATT